MATTRGQKRLGRWYVVTVISRQGRSTLHRFNAARGGSGEMAYMAFVQYLRTIEAWWHTDRVDTTDMRRLMALAPMLENGETMAPAKDEPCDFPSDISEARPEGDKWEQLTYIYSLDDPQQIRAFLDAEPAFYDTLMQAYEPIREAFGGNIRLLIDCVADAGETVLRVTVETPKEVATALKSMRAFYRKWWVHRSVEERSLVAWAVHPGR